MAALRDNYANVMSGEVTTNGTTIVSKEIQTGVSLGEGRGMIIDQIDYHLPTDVLTDFDTTNDYLRIMWSTQTPTVVATDFRFGNSRLIHMTEIARKDFGVAATGILSIFPHSYQFFPPLIVAAPRLFLSCAGVAAIAGGKVFSRVYFRYVKLSPQEYIELAESFVLVS